jgi:hypothetical protein
VHSDNAKKQRIATWFDFSSTACHCGAAGCDDFGVLLLLLLLQMCGK